MIMKKKVVNFTYYFWFFLLLFFIPISSGLFARGIFELLSSREFSSLMNFKITAEYSYYLSLILSLTTTMLVIVYLKKRFMLFEIEKDNNGTAFWMTIICYLLTQHIQIYFYPKWWNINKEKTLNYDLLKNTVETYSELYTFFLPHMSNAFFLFFAIQILIWISDIEKNFKEIRLLFKKLFFTKEELEKILDYKTEVPLEKKEEYKEKKESFLSQKKLFTYSDYKQFMKNIQLEN